MVKLAALLAALAVSATVLLSSSYGAQWIASHHIPHWAVLIFNALVPLIWVMLAVYDKRRAKPPANDERLTPLVRRSPLTGLREL